MFAARSCRVFLGVSLLALACRVDEATSTVTDLPRPPLLASPAASVAQLCDGEIRSWSVLADGREVAVTRGACVGEDERGWHLLAQVTVHGELQPHYEFHLWLDDEGGPVVGQLRTPTSNTDFRWNAGELRISRLGEVRVIPAPPAGGTTWVTPSHSLFVREVMLRLGVGRHAESVTHRSYAPEHDAVVETELRLTTDEQGVVASADSGFLRLADEDGSLAGLRVLAGHAGDQPLYTASSEEPRLVPSLPERPTPSYTGGDDLQIVAVTVPGDATAPALAGELVMPTSASVGPRPGVLFLSGSGPQERHGFVPGQSIDVGSHEIHDSLARAGFVVLRLDDRGVGESELGANATPGYLDYVDDARRAARFLAADPRVDPRRILVVGHGEGALTAAKIAKERITARGKRHKPVGVVLLAAPGRNLREVIYGEIRASLADADADTRERAVADARRIHDAAVSNAELPASSEPQRDWMIEIFREDPLAVVRALDSPVLALQGGKDFQIDPELDFQALARVIASDAPPGSDAKLFEALDHLFKPEPTRSVPGHYADLGRRVDADFLSYLRDWARQRARL